MSALIEARDLSAGYNAAPVIRGVNLKVEPGEVVVLLGANGAGKTTTMMTLAGALKPMGGEVHLNGSPTKAPLHKRAREGLGLVTETKSVFMKMTCAENIRVGRSKRAEVLELFPELGKRIGLKAGLMSGGEQQMLTLARALARHPKILLADELSLGLAPLIVERLLNAVRAAADSGVGVLLVEQHVGKALKVADRAYVMRRGVIEMSGSAAELRSRVHEIEASYLSTGGGDVADAAESTTDTPPTSGRGARRA